MKTKLHPILIRMERCGMRYKSNGVEGKYIIGYAIYSKLKKEFISFYMKHKHTPKQAKSIFNNLVIKDKINPHKLTW